MTVPSETYRNAYVATSLQTVFPYDFKILDETHLAVYQNGTLLTITTQYTVSNVGNGSGGNVTLVTGATASDTITIIRSVPLTQETDYVENDSFPAETHEEALDKLTMQIQELNERMDRALILDVDSTSTGLTFPDPIAGNFIQWNSGGTGFENQSALGTLGSVFNEAGAAVDFRVESDTLTHAIFVDGSADTVTIVGTVFSATGVVDGRTIATDGTKLDTIETNADVTDYTNVSGVLAAPSANLVFNESAGDYDLRVEGTTATGLLFVDAGSNRVGVSAGASSLITDGLFHIASGSAGVVTASTDADEVVIEGTGNVGASIITDITGQSILALGDTSNSIECTIAFSHLLEVLLCNVDSKAIWSASANTGSIFNDGGDAALDFRVEGDTSDHLFFVDAGNNRAGVSLSGNLVTDGLFHIASGSAGVVVANAVADELVIEGNTGVGMSFLSDATSVQRITYGDPGSNLKAQIFYNHNADVWSVFTDSDDQLSIYAATGTVFNEGGVASLDFRVEGDTSTHLLFCDAGNNRAGVSLSGNLVTDGLFHIATASAGAVTASADADELVLEGSGNVGLSILAGSSASSLIYFGDSASPAIGGIQYAHSTDIMYLISAGNICVDLSSSGVIFNESGSASLDFRVESDLNTHMFFVDAGNNSVHIDNSLLTGAGDGDLVMANNTDLRFINIAGTTSANYGIGSSSVDDRLFFRVPSATAVFDFRWAGVNRGWLEEENSGMGLVFSGESSADHGAPAANGCVVYTKDNGAGKTQLMARFATGAAQQIAIQP